MRITKTTLNMAERRGMFVVVTEHGSIEKDEHGKPCSLVCVMLKRTAELNYANSNVENAMVYYTVVGGYLWFERCSLPNCDETRFVACIRSEAELRVSLDGIRETLDSAVVEVPVVEVPVVEVPVVNSLVRIADDYISESAVLPHIAAIVDGTLHDLPENSAVRTVLNSVLTFLRSPVPEMHAFPEVVPVAVPEDEILSETEVDWNDSQNDNVESGTIVFVIRQESGHYYHSLFRGCFGWETSWQNAGEYFTAYNAKDVVDRLTVKGISSKVYKREYRG